MSLRVGKTNRVLNKAGIIGLGLAGLVTAVGAAVPASGAWFTDSRQANIAFTTGSVGLELTSPDGTVNSDGMLDLQFDNLKPGESQRVFFTATNKGTVESEMTIDSDGVATDKPGLDTSVVHFKVDSQMDDLPITAAGDPFDMGRIGIGESRPFSITASIDPAAGNEWQNVAVHDAFHVTLTQPHAS